ncbi:MAG: sirohydrochlorin cobaltochelatase [Sarcina sp.]
MKTVILLVHFGTANKTAIENAIYTLESDVRTEVRDKFEIRNSFMLKRICMILKKNEDINIKHLSDTLEDIKEEGYENIIIQPVYFMLGDEYKRIEIMLEEYNDVFKSIKLGEPLIYGEGEVLNSTCDEVVKSISKVVDVNMCNLFIGHGSDKYSNKEYNIIEQNLNNLYDGNILVGTLASENNLEYIISVVKEKQIKELRVSLLFMLLGKHVKNDIIQGENSWCNSLKNLGVDVEVLEKSLLEYSEIRDIFVRRIRNLI